MAAITASMVAELRGKTDAPMMECKRALTEAEGDMVKAEELLRVKLGSKAGKAAARQTGLAMLATLRSALGSLDRVKRIIKTFGLVNCTPEFSGQPAVINGFSELMAEVFGPDAGVGARSAVGATSLPGNMAVEVEAIFEIE